MSQPDASKGKSVLVAVTTRGDRELSALLEALSIQSPRPTLRVVVNAPTPSDELLNVCSHYGAELVLEPRRGYATARNAALKSIERFDYLVFFDDDQIPVSGWLESLLRAAADSRATIVLGPVEAVVPVGAWASPADVRPPRPIGDGPYTGEGYSGNTLIRTDFLSRSSLAFDRRYDSTGGEDTDFFRRARDAGATMAFTSKARAIESVASDRMTAVGRLRAGHEAGVRYRHLQGFTVITAAKKGLRVLRGLARIAFAALALSRIVAGRGLFDIGNAFGYFNGSQTPGAPQ